MSASQNDWKKVSVVVPNYNYAKYMKGRLKSILKQTYPIYELIVLDDCSSDGSVEVIEKEIQKIKKKRPELKVSFVKNETNSGKVMRQWKKGIELATGEYVWIAEADDMSRPKFLEEVMKGFDDAEVVISYSESAVINSVGLMVAPNFRWSRDKERTGHYSRSYAKNGEDEIREIMAIRCTIPNVSAVVFKKSEKLVQYIDDALKYRQVGDWYLYLRLLEDGKIAYSRKSLNKFRVHGGSATLRGGGHIEEMKEIHNDVMRKFNLSAEVVENIKKEERRYESKR